MTSAAGPAYVAVVLMLYVDLPDTPLKPSARDRWLAGQLRDQGVPVELVESALLLASLRRLMRSADLPPLPPIRSLAYFQPVITELQQQPLPSGYLDYLRSKLRKVVEASPTSVQKPPVSDDR